MPGGFMSRYALLVVFSLLVLDGCGASYHYTHHADGSCELSIISARDVQTGDIKITPSCGVAGSADSLSVNEKAIDTIGALVNKIP